MEACGGRWWLDWETACGVLAGSHSWTKMCGHQTDHRRQVGGEGVGSACLQPITNGNGLLGWLVCFTTEGTPEGEC